jgi:site-specific DNA-methyltransferase (adenine-specific)
MLENYGINIYNRDCLEAMRGMPDNAFDLAIVDPPYGIARFGNRVELSNRLCKSAKLNEWDIKPTKEYFDELFRVSSFQIIWGGNNFTLPNTEYFIIWNKQQTVENFASAEYAWTNIKKPAQVFDYSIHKTMADRKEDGGKIHPTQKPVALYKWLLDKYAKEGDKILDTHLGSGSIAIACYEYGFNLTGFELDTDYFNAAKQRVENHIQSHPKLF